MKAIVCFIVGAQLLAGGAMLALQDKPVTYEVVHCGPSCNLEDELNERAAEGCRLIDVEGRITFVGGDFVAIMECE